MGLALNEKEAAEKLGIGRSHFRKVIRPHIKRVNLASPGSTKPMYRWRTETLDEYLKQREA